MSVRIGTVRLKPSQLRTPGSMWRGWVREQGRAVQAVFMVLPVGIAGPGVYARVDTVRDHLRVRHLTQRERGLGLLN